MLLLVTLALVVASAVLLILGFVQDALGFIYLSMLCAGVAALALFVFARLARRRGAALAGAGIAGGTSPYLAGADREEAPAVRIDPEPGRTRQMAPVATAPKPIEDDDFGYDEDEEPVVVAPVPRVTTPSAADADTWAAEDASEDWGDEILFPIEDYDELRVAEILPLLAQLEMDELQEVRDREVSGKARGTILDRIDDRLGRRPATAAATAPIPVLAPGPATAPAPPPAPTRGRPPAGRVAKAAPAAKKTAGRKAAAAPVARGRKAAPAPAPAPAKATATRKAASTAAAPARAAAKKASGAAGKAASAATTAKKAPAKKTAAAKAVVTKAAAAPGKKAAASKAAPAKKATKATAKKR